MKGMGREAPGQRNGGRRASRAPPPVGTDPARLLEAVLNAVRGTRIAELDIEWDGGRVHIRREPTLGLARALPETGDPLALDQPPAESLVVRSTYVGVFHREPAGQFPTPGERVAAGQTIAEVETLRIRNPVIAPADGTLAQVLVADRTPVEYGQPLLVIEERLPGGNEA